ncbi:hypothetical protein [Parvicella tangerina]|uniref:Uncharacterized protein n=1 Tax=Parvicella tangerina TaxID=2829795 RepID=A0A916NQV7_9FLAO|nr:hypothetical protein [Parvicella tangerina]CAG5079981.1 hypothetical protein CRYO30217_01140 [Parvicella tangerina]
MKVFLFILTLIFAFQGYAQSKNQDYAFSYKILEFDRSKEKKVFGTAFVEFKLINNTKDTLFYFSHTCDGDAYLITTDRDVKNIIVEPWFLCNASYPCVNHVLPDSSEVFSFGVLFRKKVKSLRFEFILEQVISDYYRYGGKYSGNHYIFNTHENFNKLPFKKENVIQRELKLSGSQLEVQ